MNRRAYVWCGPTYRQDGPSPMTVLAINRIPGWQAFVCECRGDDSLLGKRDINVSVDWAADTLGYGDFVIPRPNVFWISDTHVSQEAWEYRRDKSREFDRVFVSIWSDGDRFKKEGISAKWLPYAADPMIWEPEQGIEQKYDVGFVGHLMTDTPRVAFLETMFKEFPRFDIAWNLYGNEGNRRMAACKIVLNHCVADSVNQRVFESMAAGHCLLTPRTTDAAWLGLEDEENCLLYGSIEEAIEKCRKWLPRKNGRGAIGEKARKFVIQKHTYVHRACELLGLPLPPDMDRLVLTYRQREQGEFLLPVRR